MAAWAQSWAMPSWRLHSRRTDCVIAWDQSQGVSVSEMTVSCELALRPLCTLPKILALFLGDWPRHMMFGVVAR